jgi:hypothetical protein
MSSIVVLVRRPASLPRRLGVGREAGHRAGLLDGRGDLGGELLQQAAAAQRQLAADQIEGLDVVGALVDHGDAHVAQVLLDRPVGGEAGAAHHLHGLADVLEAALAAEGLDDRRHQGHPVFGLARSAASGWWSMVS